MRRFLSFLGLLATAFVFLHTQQRGAFFCLASMLLVGGIIWLWRRITVVYEAKEKLRIAYWSLGGLLTVIGVVLTFVSWGHEGAGKLGLGRLARVSWQSNERLAIWKGAWDGMVGHWLFGHGYATWYREGARLAQKYRFYEILDTAHDFFVQTIFELGLLQFLGIGVAFALIIVCSIRGSMSKRSKVEQWALYWAGLLPVLLVQEVDFIRSTFFLHATFFGWMAMRNSPIGVDGNRTIPSLWVSKFLKIASVAAFMLAAVCASSFSLAGYQFEANAHTGYEPRVRWLRPHGTVTYVSTSSARERLYAAYQVLSSESSSFEAREFIRGYDLRQGSINLKTQETNLVVRARPIYQPPDYYDFGRGRFNNGRHIIVMISWPPIMTRLPIERSSGLFGWEGWPDTVGAVRWCGIDCQMVFQPCPGAGAATLEVVAARPDVSAENELIVSARNGASTQELHFQAEGDVRSIAFNSVDELALVSSHPFQGAIDTRKLGILLRDFHCSE